MQVAVDNGVLRVIQDPGFVDGNGDGNPYRSVLVVTGTGIIFGREVPARTNSVDRWPGFFATRGDLMTWRLALPAGDYQLRVYGGSYYYYGPQGDDPGQYIEWNSTDLGRNPSGVPRENLVGFEVGVPPVEQTPSSQLPAELQTNIDNTVLEMTTAKADYASWAKANPGEYQKVQDYLAALGDGHNLAPPNLVTHRGRGVVGVLQTHPIAKGLAK